MGTELNQVYRCNICGNITEVLHTGASSLVCCGEKMELLVENSVDAAKEKHVPVIEKTEGTIKIKVGEVPHPMEEEHHIEWIEIIAGDVIDRVYLKPGDKPEASFNISAENIIARAYCNLHGLWSKELV